MKWRRFEGSWCFRIETDRCKGVPAVPDSNTPVEKLGSSNDTCIFCQLDPQLVVFAEPLVYAIWDAFPVSPGHALIIPRRHVASWFDATPEEQSHLMRAGHRVREEIERHHQPDGYNLGINVGQAAGQTVFHLHLHIIPRYHGDVQDPTGGVRHVIPQNANYLAINPNATVGPQRLTGSRLLVKGDTDPLLPHLIAALDQAIRIDIAVAFIQPSGLQLLLEHLRDLLLRCGSARVLTGDYLDATDPDALVKLLDLHSEFPHQVQLRIFEATKQSFHPKAYLISLQNDETTAFIGSSNLTRRALLNGIEWNYRITSVQDPDGIHVATHAFEELFQHPATKPLTDGWIASYRARRATMLLPTRVDANLVEREAPGPLPTPHSIQQEALDALRASRAEGARAGLVVLATGLGKTWLSAFDSQATAARRILFVAHREEILSQAMQTFRTVRPAARLGRFQADEKSVDAEVLFASIQTLGKSQHLQQFAPETFDYIVIDEFHHAAARTYRQLIDHFTPHFLLGLTATPERTDGGDLLSLCHNQLIYRCDIGRAIDEDLLCPFAYHGVPDEVNYANIPWRSHRFDPAALTNAVATQERAANAIEQYRRLAGERTLGFCCSQEHADFMAERFRADGLRAASVHSGPSSDPRATSLERLRDGELDILFSVDMFNEGVDLPSIDTVLMLRPTESSIIWLQQLGRGLRRAIGKSRLTVIDYIGNHRAFLVKLQSLLSIVGETPRGDTQLRSALRLLQSQELKLPRGCDVTYELQTIRILESMLRKESQSEAIRSFYQDFCLRTGVRPTASEMFNQGFNPRSLRRDHGSWFGFVAHQGDLTDPQKAASTTYRDLLTEIEGTPMTKSLKMLTLLAMLQEGAFPGSISIHRLAHRFKHLSQLSGAIRRDFTPEVLENDEALERWIVQNPIDAWVGRMDKSGRQLFEYKNGIFRTVFPSDVASSELCDLVRELVDWRIADYESRDTFNDSGRIVLRVLQSHGRPILKLDRKRHPETPIGWTTVMIDDVPHEVNFVKEFVNVAKLPDTDSNVLPAILQRWFGRQAGQPGTRFEVELIRTNESWTLTKRM